ncbi:MAG TPA: tetratricopeptide repeat protein [Polyangiaceae bacterium]|nr:tetratricopeptide repeat protein [Polyangiaceae bacterium]
MKRALILVGLLCACAPALPPSYVRAEHSAEQAYEGGQFVAAAQYWLEAAESAASPRDRAEARYRAATADERAGDVERARSLYTQLANGKSERAARSTFALADLRLRSGDEAGGYAELEAAIRKYPSSGVAGLALRRYFAELAEHGGDAAVLAYISRVEPGLDQSERAEQLLYERARRLENEAKLAEARDAYLVVAERFPYPYGAYWDDALFHGASCEERLDNPTRAIALLERMLAAREVSHMTGSYERPRYAEAAFHLAELYRDALHDEPRARRAFHAFYVDFPSSILRDDALWQEALLARHASNTEACAPLAILLQQIPDSRYAPCAAEICDSLKLTPARPCHDYIRREINGPPSATKAE